MSDDREHAVRWLLRKVGLLEQWTRWHWTKDASRTTCGRMIPVGQETAFLPETDDSPLVIDCTTCQKQFGLLE